MLTTRWAKAYPGTEGTAAVVRMALLGPHGPTGTYVDRHGVVPW